MYKDMHINKSNISSFKLNYDNKLVSLINNCFNDLARKINNIIEPTNIFHNLLLSCLNVFYEFRPNIQKLQTKALELNPIELSKKRHNIESRGQFNKICISDDVMKVAIVIDSVFIELLSYSKEVIDNADSVNFINKITLILENFDKRFSVAYDNFFDSNSSCYL